MVSSSFVNQVEFAFEIFQVLGAVVGLEQPLAFVVGEDGLRKLSQDGLDPEVGVLRKVRLASEGVAKLAHCVDVVIDHLPWRTIQDLKHIFVQNFLSIHLEILDQLSLLWEDGASCLLFWV